MVGPGRMGGSMARRLVRGAWAIEQGVPAPVLMLALMARFASPGRDDYGARLLAMMRKGFGGHAVSTPEA